MNPCRQREEFIIRDGLSSEALETLLNDLARDGWEVSYEAEAQAAADEAVIPGQERTYSLEASRSVCICDQPDERKPRPRRSPKA